jgi:AraC family transcriptional regulator
MQVTAEVRGPVKEPYLQVHKDNALGMLLRPGSMEFGPRRSALRRTTFNAGEMGLCTPHSEQWIGTAEMEHLIVSISDAALTAACDRGGGSVELHPRWKMTDARLSSLLVAVNSERVAGFPSGRLFLDSVEQALAAALVNGYAECHRPVQTYRGGLSPARLRRVKELVHAKMEDELSLRDLAHSVGLSTAHFSEMFRKSTGETPHQFVLRLRVERAKEMLRSAESRVLDVAIACGFKTQQHFARVFRHVCGLSPKEYRWEFMRFETPGPSKTFLLDIPPVTATASSQRAPHIREEPQAGNMSRESLLVSSGQDIRGQQLLKQV